MFEFVLGTDAGGLRHEVKRKPTTIGRDPACGVVVSDSGVSRQHVLIWLRGDQVWLQDLKSRNGTFVNDRRITDAVVVQPGDRIMLGPSIDLKLLRRAEGQAAREREVLMLEDVAGGTRYPIGPHPLHIGSHPRCEVKVRSLDGDDVVVSSHQGGKELWLGRRDEMQELALGEIFAVGTVTFRVCRVPGVVGSTVLHGEPTWPYQIEVRMDPRGPVARVIDTRSGAHHTLFHTNRAVVLYLLAKRWAKDTSEGLPKSAAGWLEDEAVARGVWGRDADPRQLKVLVCRLRAALRSVGLDGWMVERRRGHLRVRVGRAIVS